MGDAEKGLKSAAGAGLGALLGGTVGAKFPSLVPFGIKTGSRLLHQASSGSAAAGMGGMLGAGIANFGDTPASVGGQLGAGVGGLIGSYGAVPFVRANPKNALLKFLLATGAGASIGAGIGGYKSESIYDRAKGNEFLDPDSQFNKDLLDYFGNKKLNDLVRKAKRGGDE